MEQEKRHLKFSLDSADKRENNPSRAWDLLFEKYNIVSQIEQDGYFDISTKQMMRNSNIQSLWKEKFSSRQIPDNRNILKFDFSADLPNIFKGYNLQIMPIGENTYRIAPFDMYQKLKNKDVEIIPMTSPLKVASLDFNNITTEPNAQTVAEVTGMFAYVFHALDKRNKTVVATLSGKNNVQDIHFSVNSTLNKQPLTFQLNTWQTEIDGVYESEETILIVESKMKFPKDFNIRQLFIPRLLIEQIMTRLNTHKKCSQGTSLKQKICTSYPFTNLQILKI
ncbi:type II restriction enzyme [Lactiplantibacillus plajomi]|uniref:Type II restriction enzyme n=1 Tax=Lactiplantibacillus plajomi TaxID=1457217 RepID=A0ABV6K1W4_9LACO|nr:hypothetical protein [Lactiplantibacillus plajomi]